MTVPDQPHAANGDTSQPLTVGSLAAHPAEQVSVEYHVAATPLTAEHVAAMAAASAAPTATPATPEAWAPYIPDHGFAPAAVKAACSCPGGGRGGTAEFQVHIAGCEQRLEGKAQPFAAEFCAEFDFEPVTPIDAVTFGAKLRGITPVALVDTMALENEDREFTSMVQQLRGDQPSITDVEWSATVARRQRAREDTDVLLNELRWIVTETEYDDVLDGLSSASPQPGRGTPWLATRRATSRSRRRRCHRFAEAPRAASDRRSASPAGLHSAPPPVRLPVRHGSVR